jgi:hypothetical protein
LSASSVSGRPSLSGNRPRQQFGHFGLQLHLDLAGVLKRQRAVSAVTVRAAMAEREARSK